MAPSCPGIGIATRSVEHKSMIRGSGCQVKHGTSYPGIGIAMRSVEHKSMIHGSGCQVKVWHELPRDWNRHAISRTQKHDSWLGLSGESMAPSYPGIGIATRSVEQIKAFYPRNQLVVFLAADFDGIGSGNDRDPLFDK